MKNSRFDFRTLGETIATFLLIIALFTGAVWGWSVLVIAVWGWCCAT